jgi:hypothetical protein
MLLILAFFLTTTLHSCCSLLNVTPDYDYNYEPLAGTVVHQDGSPAFDVSISDVMYPFVPNFAGDSTSSDTSGNYFLPTGYVEIVKDANGDCSGGKNGIARDFSIFSMSFYSATDSVVVFFVPDSLYYRNHILGREPVYAQYDTIYVGPFEIDDSGVHIMPTVVVP